MRDWNQIRKISMEAVEKESDRPLIINVSLGMSQDQRERVRQGDIAEEIGLIFDQSSGNGSRMYVATELGRSIYPLWRDESTWTTVAAQLGTDLPHYDLHALTERLQSRSISSTQLDPDPFTGELGQACRELLIRIRDAGRYEVSTEDTGPTRALHQKLRWLEHERYVYRGSSWNAAQEVWHISKAGEACLATAESAHDIPKSVDELHSAIQALGWFTKSETDQICELVRGRNSADSEDPVGPSIRTILQETLPRVGNSLDMLQKMDKAVTSITKVIHWVQELYNKMPWGQGGG